MTNNKMIYLVKVSRDPEGTEWDGVIVFATLDENLAHDFVDEYGSSSYMDIVGHPLDTPLPIE